MTGHKGNSEFCFPETLNVSRGEAEGNIEVDSKIEKAPKKVICLRPLHTLAALAKLSGCKTNLFYRKVTITVFFFAANKKYSQY